MACEVDVTGRQKYQKKTVINSKDIHQFVSESRHIRSKKSISNVLFARSYVVTGHGKALVCAVGANTQYGMSLAGDNLESQGHIIDEELEFKDMLESYSIKIGIFANYFAVFYIVSMMYKHHYSFSHDSENDAKLGKDLQHLLQLFIYALTLMISVIPEALSLAAIYCLSEYSSLNVFESGKIMFRRLKSLENMGRVDCLCLEKQGTLTISGGMRVETLKLSGTDFLLDAEEKTEQVHKRIPNFIVPNIWFNTSAWVEDRVETIISKRVSLFRVKDGDYQTKGNITEQALLKYILEQPEMKKDLEFYQKSNFEVLHWQGFNPVKKRSVIVLRFGDVYEYEGQMTIRTSKTFEEFSDMMTDEEKSQDEFNAPSPDDIFVFTKGAHEIILD